MEEPFEDLPLHALRRAPVARTRIGHEPQVSVEPVQPLSHYRADLSDLRFDAVSPDVQLAEALLEHRA